MKSTYSDFLNTVESLVDQINKLNDEFTFSNWIYDNGLFCLVTSYAGEGRTVSCQTREYGEFISALNNEIECRQLEI